MSQQKAIDAATLRFFSSCGFTTGEAAKVLGASLTTVRKYAEIEKVSFPNKRAAWRRFHLSYQKDPQSGCWNWTGTQRGNGYGCIGDGGKLISAHRFSFELFHMAPIPDEMFVCHRCDNRKCVNPDHLFLGSPSDNTLDMHEKGRAKPPHGEVHHACKLRRPEIEYIRASNESGRSLSRRYNVAESTISKIRNGRRRARG